MIFSDIVRALLVLAIPAVWIQTGSLTGVYGILFLMGTMSAAFIPARQSALPGLVEARQLVVANSLAASVGVIANCVGVSLSTVYTALFPAAAGAYSGFVINSLALLASAVFLWKIRADLKPLRHEHPFESVWGELKYGFQSILADRLVLTLTAFFGVFAFILGLFVPIVLGFLSAAGGVDYEGWRGLVHQAAGVIEAAGFKRPNIQIENLALGILTAAMAVGLGSGLILVAKKKSISHSAILPYVSLLMMGIFFCVMGMTKSYTALFVIVILLGLFTGGVVIPIDTRLQIHVPDKLRGRVFSARQMVFNSVLLIAQLFLVTGTLFRIFGAAKLLLGLGMLTVLAAIIGYFLTPRHLRRGHF
ncbi:MFS transporter [Oscillatoria amoena NRMC-F 0135]|nr:MFS transporter [Oscillatoria amoena NRMC-F 0135]